MCPRRRRGPGHHGGAPGAPGRAASGEVECGHRAGAQRWRAVVGTLGVRTWLGSEARGDFHTTTFTRPVELPPGARKRFTFAVPISGIADPVEVTLRTGETVLAQQRLDLREALHAEQVIVGLTQDVSLDFLATVFTKTHTRVVYCPRANYPNTGAATIVCQPWSLRACPCKPSAQNRTRPCTSGSPTVAL